jgi:hypothetical protein
MIAITQNKVSKTIFESDEIADLSSS